MFNPYRPGNVGGFARRGEASLPWWAEPAKPSRERAGPGKADMAPKVLRAPCFRPPQADSGTSGREPTCKRGGAAGPARLLGRHLAPDSSGRTSALRPHLSPACSGRTSAGLAGSGLSSGSRRPSSGPARPGRASGAAACSGLACSGLAFPALTGLLVSRRGCLRLGGL